jgi:hypothetical protein
MEHEGEGMRAIAPEELERIIYSYSRTSIEGQSKW